MTDFPASDHCFMVFSFGRVEEIDPNGETVGEWQGPGLYDRLVMAGYPLHGDPGTTFDGIVSLAIDSRSVVAHTTGAHPREHPMGEVSAVFLDWYRTNVEEAP